MQLIFTCSAKTKEELFKYAIETLTKISESHIHNNFLESGRNYDLDISSWDDFKSLYELHLEWEEEKKRQEFYDE